MDLDAIFGVINIVAMAGWVALLAGPLIPLASQRIAGFACPAILALVYMALLISGLAGDPPPTAAGPSPGFTTLDGVAAIFATRQAVLTGWAHYLAFDLLVGAWEAREARRRGVAHWKLVPCLGLTFVAGPLGFLAFLCLRAFHRSNRREIGATR